MRKITLRICALALMSILLSVNVCAFADSDEGANAPRALIVYFSCTGNTRAAAQTLGELAGCEVFELLPQTPYTDADLDYNDPESRANTEIQDASARPAIAEMPENLGDYDVIYLGYPIWWGDLPPIMRTFLEGGDFAGKTVMPFCTSGGSGIDTSVSTIRSFLPDSEVRDGLRVTADASGEAFGKWLEENNMKTGNGTFYVHVGDTVLTAAFEDNKSAAALRELLAKGPVTIEMSDYGSFEKVGPLPSKLPRTDTHITTSPGDIILYQGDKITIYYDVNTWDFTLIGKITGVSQDELSQDELKKILGGGDVSVVLSLESEATK